MSSIICTNTVLLLPLSVETRTDKDTPTLYPIQLHERLLAIQGALSAKRRLAFKIKIIFDAEILLLFSKIQRYTARNHHAAHVLFYAYFVDL